MPVESIRLVLAEDDPTDADLELRELKRAGLRIAPRIVHSEESFVAALREHLPEVIISDFSMPGFDGMTALHIAKDLAPDIPFLFVSGTLGEDYAIRALKNGATDYVLKTNLMRLPSAVERAIAGAVERRKLRLAESGLRRAQAMAKLAHVLTGPRGVFESWSELLPSLIGRDPAEIPASTRGWLKLIHPEDRAVFHAAALQADCTGKRTEVEYRLQHARGEWLHIRQVIEPVVEEGPASPQHWFSMLQDVTAQKQAEEAVRAAQENYQSVFNNSTVGMFVLAPDGAMASANPTLSRMLGYGSAEAMMSAAHSIAQQVYVDPNERKRYHDLLRSEGAVSDFETQWRRKDGGVIWVSLHGREVHDSKGELIHQLGIAEDITERRHAEIQIRRLNRVHAVLSGINALIVRARTRDELFAESCRIAAEQGRLPLAWIGAVDANTNTVRPVASSGDASFVSKIPLDRGLIAHVIRERVATIANDIETDERMLVRSEALTRGYRSLVALPLIAGGSAVGVLVLYAEQPGFFDEQEMRLLSELAGDISFAIDHIEKADKLEYLSYYDPTTGIANRMLLMERLAQAIRSIPEGGKLALSIIDIERFKTINDTLGRQAGDALLREMAGRLTELARDPARVARVGADQFAVFLPRVRREETVARVIEEGYWRVEGQPFSAVGDLRIAIRSGVALYPNDASDADSLFKHAEAALKRAKIAGEKYLFYTQQMSERIAERLSLENELRRGIDNEEFMLHYQPKLDLKTGAIAGVEALLRWPRPGGGFLPPLEFIPILEETGLIAQVGSWALRRAVADHRRLAGEIPPAPRIAVNISAVQLRQKNFVQVVEEAMAEGMVPTGLDLEITESVVMDDVLANALKLKALRTLGVKISIDDFGTGYSSLGYLAQLPVQALKIDRSFVIGMDKSENGMTLVSTVISLAHSLKLKVIAEGVETEAQRGALQAMGCDMLQGYIFAKPMPYDELVKMLSSRNLA